MAVRDYILNNFKWKVSALLLSILVWFLIHFADSNGWRPQMAHPFSDFRIETLTNQPVGVLSDPGDVRSFQLDPPGMDIEVRGRVQAFNRLATNDIKLFVDLTDMMPNIRGGVREVRYSGPREIEVRFSRPNVIVELISPLESSLTNSLSKP